MSLALGYRVSGTPLASNEHQNASIAALMKALVVLFPTYDAPHYKYAYQMLIMFGGLAIVGTYLLNYLHQREL